MNGSTSVAHDDSVAYRYATRYPNATEQEELNLLQDNEITKSGSAVADEKGVSEIIENQEENAEHVALELIDSEALWVKELKVRNYLDDKTIPFEEREKLVGEYNLIIEEIERRKEGE